MLIEGVVSRVPSAMEGLQRVCQNAVDSGLTSASRPYQHYTMTH